MLFDVKIELINSTLLFKTCTMTLKKLMNEWFVTYIKVLKLMLNVLYMEGGGGVVLTLINMYCTINTH